MTLIRRPATGEGYYQHDVDIFTTDEPQFVVGQDLLNFMSVDVESDGRVDISYTGTGDIAFQTTGTLHAFANDDSLRGVFLAQNFDADGYTGVRAYGLGLAFDYTDATDVYASGVELNIGCGTDAGVTVTDWRGINIETLATGTVTTGYGIYINDITAGTAYTIYTGTGLACFGGGVTPPVIIVPGTAKVSAKYSSALTTTYGTGVFGYIDQTVGNTAGAKGVLGGAYSSHTTGNVAVLLGVSGIANAKGAGTVGLAVGVLGQMFQSTGAGTVTSGACFYADTITATGTITTAYGLYIANQTAGATNYAIYTGAGAVRFGDEMTATQNPLTAYPASVTVTDGGAPVGTVAGVQTMLDGSVYQVPEVAATPGFDVRFNFTGIAFTPNAIVHRSWYDGTTTHQVTIELWDYVTEAFVPVSEFEASLTYEVQQLPFPEGARWTSGGAAIVRFNHSTGGNASQDMYWDYVGLWRIA